MERYQVSGFDWELVFDDAGFGALASEERDETLLLEEVFQRRLYTSASGEWTLLACGKWHPWTELMRRYESTSISWQHGRMHHEIKLEGF